MDEITSDLDFVFVYIDDILIASENEEQHREHLRILFRRLAEYGLVINVAKSHLGKSEVTFLGHVINAYGMHPPQDRVQAILDFPRPSTIKKLRGFLGTINFYRKFIKGTVQIHTPLNAVLTGPDAKSSHPVTWTPALEEVFEKCKKALAEAT